MSRRRRGGGGTSRGTVLAVIAVVMVFGGGHMAASSFTAGDAPRGSVVAVSGDDGAVHALDVATAVHINSTETLVTVTNRFDRTVTVTVSLRPGSASIGDLVVDGTNVGDEVSFTLADGASETVEITIPDDSSLTDETVYFDVNATDTGLDVTAPNRSAPVNG